MEPSVFDKVHETDLKKTMEQSYVDYVTSVINARALPGIRDGLKPIQRRMLYSVMELNNGSNKPHRKCARIVGGTMGKYHPHGDSSTYDTLVNMAQEWSTRYPPVGGHRNFGSVDDGGAVAMRYAEAHLNKTSTEMPTGINRDTVDFILNSDEIEREPFVPPFKYPNLLANGTFDIVVGMATSISPHSLREIIDAVVEMIGNRMEEDKEISLEEIMEIVKGPDFPAGVTILGRRGIGEACRTGHAKVKACAMINMETMANRESRIIVTGLPYMVNKICFIEKIADLVKEKKIDGITYIGDKSNREGMRISIELRRDINTNVILNQLLKRTQFQDTLGVIMLALISGQPKVLNLHRMLEEYLKHQEEVVTRETQYNLNKTEERAHILRGLLIALDHIDEVIRIIRGSANVVDAKSRSMERFGSSDAQPQAIVGMGLRALTGLEREKLKNEYRELQAKIEELKATLADKGKLLIIIRDEIMIISDKYGDDHHTAIEYDGDMSMEDLIPDEYTIVTITRLNYTKHMDVGNFRNQNRGGKGIRGMWAIEGDHTEDLLVTTDHRYMMFFTNTGRVYRLKTYEMLEAGRAARGMAIVNLLQLMPEEEITTIIPIRKFNDDKYPLTAIENGTVRKMPMVGYEHVRKNGLQTTVLRDGDELIEVEAADNTQDIPLVTHEGMCIRFNETDVGVIGRISIDATRMRFEEDDEVIGIQMQSQGDNLLMVSENDMGKRTVITEFSPQNGGGKGVICHECTDKIDYLVGARLVNDDKEIMITTTGGIITRMTVDDTSVIGRNTSGARLMNINQGSDIKVASIAKVRESVTKDSNVYDEGYYKEESGNSKEESGTDADSNETV